MDTRQLALRTHGIFSTVDTPRRFRGSIARAFRVAVGDSRTIRSFATSSLPSLVAVALLVQTQTPSAAAAIFANARASNCFTRLASPSFITPTRAVVTPPTPAALLTTIHTAEARVAFARLFLFGIRRHTAVYASSFAPLAKIRRIAGDTNRRIVVPTIANSVVTAVSTTSTIRDFATFSFPSWFANTLVKRRYAYSVAAAITQPSRTAKHIASFSSISFESTVAGLITTHAISRAFHIAADSVKTVLALAQISAIFGLHYCAVVASCLTSFFHPVFVANAFWSFGFVVALPVSTALR